MKGFFLVLCSIVMLVSMGNTITQMEHIELIQGITMFCWVIAVVAVGMLGAIYMYEKK